MQRTIAVTAKTPAFKGFYTNDELGCAIKCLRDDAEGAVLAVLCIVRAHEQLFRVMSRRLNAASKTGKILPDAEVKQLGQDISHQIQILTEHVTVMKTRMDEVGRLIQPRSARKGSNQRSSSRSIMTVLRPATHFAAQAPIQIFSMLIDGITNLTRMTRDVNYRKPSRGMFSKCMSTQCDKCIS